MLRFAILISFCFSQIIIAQKPVILTDYISRETLTDYQLFYYHDQSCKTPVDEIFSNHGNELFRRIDFNKKNHDLQINNPGECVWFRFIFDNRANNQFCFHLQPNIFSTFGEYRLYQKLDNEVITERKSGFNIRPRDKDVNISGSDDLRFYIQPATKDTVYLYVKLIESSVLSDLTFSISTHDSVLSKDRYRRIVFGIFLGIMIIMLFYHFTLFLQVGEISYLYYILYILAFISFLINKEGYIYEITPQFTNAPLNTFLLEIFLLFFLLFGRSYLDTSKRLPYWDRILKLSIYFIIIGLMLSFALIAFESRGKYIPDYLQIASLSANIIAALAAMFLIILPAFILKRKKFQPARYFLVANIFLIIGVLILSLFNQYIIGKHGLEIGVTLQILAFSVGLGEKINHLKKSREFAQRKIIDQLKENANLKDKVNRELEDKVKERTKEIRLQKEQIERQNKEIKYSFDYAQKIQNTVLPPDEAFENMFSEYFIFFKPRDIVSGDFYWITQKKHKIFITASDCTGHGVPGSLMSMLGITMLYEIVNEKNFEHTDDILNELRFSIARTLKQQGKPGEQKDGMDMVMLIYDLKTHELEFSGANNPMYLIRNNEIIEFKGNNMPVAFFDNMEGFSRHTVKLEVGDRIYLFSDGFPDQFGGPDGKKFKYKPFKNLLSEISQHPMKEQQKILQVVFDEWKGNLDQIDDVLVMGLKF